MVDEIVAQPFGISQSLIALAQCLIAFGQCAFDIHARGHIDEGEERCTVGKWGCGAIENPPVAARKAPLKRYALFRHSRNGSAQGGPAFLPGKERRDKLRYA